MNIALICFSDTGSKLAVRLRDELKPESVCVHSIEKYARSYGFMAHASVSADMQALFSQYDALIFLCACGIAVRQIAPYVKNKTEDPAVLVIDDAGQYVIPILSGHLGGANVLARRVALLIGAVPVITTATDVAGRFSCDAWAAEHGCAVSSMPLAKEISAAILTRDVPITSDYPLPTVLPDGLKRDDSGELGMYIGVRTAEPFEKTLRMIPRIITIGVGCRRGTPEETIRSVIDTVLTEHRIDPRSVCRIASIDVKRDEAGLLACAEEMGVPAVFFTAAELIDVPGNFEQSAFVQQTVGVDNVCERAAVCAGGSLLVRKTALNGVTVAAGIEDWSVAF